MSTNERIYVVGATGNVGRSALQGLIASGAQITVYTRSPQKIKKADNVTTVRGDYSDLTPLEQSLPGHTRLFMVVTYFHDMENVKLAIAKRAYAAGIKQIVQISAKLGPWRNYTLLHKNRVAEEAIDAIPNRGGTHIALRPTNFMTNHFFLAADTIRGKDTILGTADPDEPQEWISPDDVGAAAVRILLEPIDKHGDAAYEMIGDVKTPAERAAILSKLLGRTITYTQVPVQEFYEQLLQTGMDHATAYYITTYQDPTARVSRGLPLLLGRQPESFEAWAAKNKAAFL